MGARRVTVIAAMVAAWSLALPAGGDAAAPKLTHARAVAKVRAAVKAGATGIADVRVTCARPRRGRALCTVTYKSGNESCGDPRVTVVRGKTRLRVQGLRVKCVPLAAPPSGESTAPPQDARRPGSAEEPRGDEPRMAINCCVTYTWVPQITDCYVDANGATLYYENTNGVVSWLETYCNFDQVQRDTYQFTGRGTMYYYLTVTNVWQPYNMCWQVLIGGVQCAPPAPTG